MGIKAANIGGGLAIEGIQVLLWLSCESGTGRGGGSDVLRGFVVVVTRGFTAWVVATRVFGAWSMVAGVVGVRSIVAGDMVVIVFMLILASRLWMVPARSLRGSSRASQVVCS